MSELARLEKHLTMCAHKERFEHKATANEVARRMTRKKGERLSAYACPDCNGYHVGRPRTNGVRR